MGQKTYVMGILNVTPDSFSDGGQHLSPAAAEKGIADMLAAGADIIDVGGQSTRPGATPISAEEEWARIEPVLQCIGRFGKAVFSVDTFYPAVARKALAAGVQVINDVSGRVDPQMAQAVAEYGAGWVLMHAEPLPKTADAAAAVKAFFTEAARKATALGVNPRQLCFDPGIGFGKTNPQSLALIAQTAQIKPAGYAYLLGASRKRCIGEPCGNPPADARDFGTVAAHTIGLWGGAHILRVHNVAAAVQAARVADALLAAKTI